MKAFESYRPTYIHRHVYRDRQTDRQMHSKLYKALLHRWSTTIVPGSTQKVQTFTKV